MKDRISRFKDLKPLPIPRPDIPEKARDVVYARKLEVGMLWMNMPALPSAEMPFGGVKDSGYGSEGGPEAMEAYLNSRSVVIQNA